MRQRTGESIMGFPGIVFCNCIAQRVAPGQGNGVEVPVTWPDHDQGSLFHAHFTAEIPATAETAARRGWRIDHIDHGDRPFGFWHHHVHGAIRPCRTLVHIVDSSRNRAEFHATFGEGLHHALGWKRIDKIIRMHHMLLQVFDHHCRKRWHRLHGAIHGDYGNQDGRGCRQGERGKATPTTQVPTPQLGGLREQDAVSEIRGRRNLQRMQKSRLEGIEANRPTVLVATGSLLGEGFDAPALDTLFLALTRPPLWLGVPVEATIIIAMTGVLLGNHGPIVAGRTLTAAVSAIEELEEAAKIAHLLRYLPMRYLTEAEIAELHHHFGGR